MLEWLAERLPSGSRLVVETDHSAICYGQQCPLSANGGFSLAYHLNAFFQLLYTFHPNAAVFFVEGAENIADGPSRATRLGSPQLVLEVFDPTFPALAGFHHPFLEPKQRSWWCL